MKRSTIVSVVIAVVLVLGIGGAIAVTALSPDAAPDASPTETDMPEAAATPSATPTRMGATLPTPTTDAAPGSYVDYSAEALAAATGERVLFFHAPWCPQCRALEADILAQGVPDGVTILKVDYDSNQALRQEYGVTIQTTVVLLDDQGAGAASFVAYDDPTLDSALTGLGISG